MGGLNVAGIVAALLALLAIVFVLPAIAATCKGWATLDDYIGDVNCGTTRCQVCDGGSCKCFAFDDLENFGEYGIKDSSRAAIAFDVLAFIFIFPALVMFVLLAMGKFTSVKYIAIPMMFIAATSRSSRGALMSVN